jgi:dienelactone hydrolase
VGVWPPASGAPDGERRLGRGGLAVARTLESIELFIYPGDGHVFTDRGLPDYDERTAALVRERVLAFL